ncbi:DNA recombination protein RmuC [Chitinophaga parva]|uniref:DNA recombination protein RmuC n=1 Tax=Chitinophaga parva TaxID=2169414 RepID=A0A2T7BL01_9BACT|nr:DNA recombination protein RmuC [Chitinophaga parva]PUZ28363.1 DNA recombination protein RmuC [Chitinophaga parva]
MLLTILLAAGLVLLLVIVLLQQQKSGAVKRQLDAVLREKHELQLVHHRLLERHELLQQQTVEGRQQMQQQFELTAQQLLQRVSGHLLEQNQVKLDDVLKPLSDRIESFRSALQHSHTAETAQRAALQAELHQLLQLNQTLSKEANNLTNALKADSKKQGNWGEVILERVLEASGLQKQLHYFTQDSRRDESGRQYRPDVVLHLPEQRQLVIDSKVSLRAYEAFCSAENEADKQAALRAHLQSVKNHIDELSQKNYSALYDNSTDFVMLFVPIEPAYALAVMQEEDLYDYAFRKRIILVSVPALLATLRIINSMWKLEQQNRNAAEIVRQGTALFEKFAGFAEDLRGVGAQLHKTQEAYDNAISKLTTGKGNLMARAQAMHKLGLNSRKDLPRDLLDKSELLSPED